MPDPIVAYTDLEIFLCDWYRQALAACPDPVCTGVQVDRVEPPGEASTWPAKLIVIRDDGTTDDGRPFGGDASIGITVLAGTRENPFVAKELARIVHAYLMSIPSGDPGNPVAAVTSRTGPYMVPEAQARARVYMTAELTVIPRPL